MSLPKSLCFYVNKHLKLKEHSSGAYKLKDINVNYECVVCWENSSADLWQTTKKDGKILF